MASGCRGGGGTYNCLRAIAIYKELRSFALVGKLLVR